MQLRGVGVDNVTMLPGMFYDRFNLSREYMMSLQNKDLLQNHYMEAGLWATPHKPGFCHWGWESPTCQLKGHFLGHWLSAAALCYRSNHDDEVKAKADRLVAELARCQSENGGRWAGSIPEKYLDWIGKGKYVWAPQYTLHKTLMGLVDMYRYAQNEQALQILCSFSTWFYDWSGKFSREEFADILDVETGGMLEVWVDLYEITGNSKHLELINRYDRHRLFEPLLEGKDVLTNMHANTTIPEVLGAARAWEVTGDKRWFDIVKAYWDQAVTKRGFFCTGGQTSGEVWTPPYAFADRLGDKTQEHCTVYNMMRLAEFLLRWTGELEYADYLERNLYNGILAQQHPETGMVAYFLPLESGGKKIWGTPTEHFWCCHGTLLQAQMSYANIVFYEHDDGLFINQHIPARLSWHKGETAISLEQTISPQTGHNVAIRDINRYQQSRPAGLCVDYRISCEEPVEFVLEFRVPWWVTGTITIDISGERRMVDATPSSRISIKRTWSKDTLSIRFPKKLCTVPLPDSPQRVAFMDGPVVLAGLAEETRLYGDVDDAYSILEPDNVRLWQTWLSGFRTHSQAKTIKFKPLYEVTEERYTVYFPIVALK
ncbi:MAG: beta-L-arabinofuranosidase domain-containing protein [Limnochordia bacterium]